MICFSDNVIIIMFNVFYISCELLMVGLGDNGSLAGHNLGGTRACKR
jgi:hypothetical protein